MPNRRISQQRNKETILECLITAFPHAVNFWEKDGRQLTNQIERRGLFDNGLSFIYMHMGKAAGSKALALELASITAGLPYVEEKWTPDPWVFRLRGLQSGFTERVSSNMPIWMPGWGPHP